MQAVATTSLIGDVVGVVGGERVALTVLLPPGSDPHTFDPTPLEARAIADAELVFVNGLGLDTAFEALVPDGGTPGLVVVSDGIDPLETDGEEAHGEEEKNHDQDADQHDDEEEKGDGDGHEDEFFDPHVWMDPNLVAVWVENIAAALAEVDPEGAAVYDANAAAYIEELRELDEWIAAQVELIPAGHRRLVTDHDSMAYFAARYGFEVVGFVVPGISTLAQPSAEELAKLIDAIQAQDVPAIFVDISFNPSLAETVAEEAGVALIPLYTASLSDPDGPAGSYLDLMRSATAAIVAGLSD